MDTTTPMYNSNKHLLHMNMTAIAEELRKSENTAIILLAVVAFHVPLLLGLSSRHRRSGNRVLRSLHWGVSAAYFPLMTYVLSYLTAYIPKADIMHATGILVLVILVQFLRAKADMAALAVAAVASPAAGDDDVNGLKIRPSTQSFINTFWVVGLVLYKIFRTVLMNQASKKSTSTSTLLSTSPSPSPSPSPFDEQAAFNRTVLITVTVLISPLWVLGACRTVVRFAAFQKAKSSFALGRNVQLIDGYMLQLREEGGYFVESESETSAAAQPRHQQLPAVVPRLIVTGERKRDVVESPLGYHVKRSSLMQLQGDEGTSRLVTLDRVWSSDTDDDDDDCRLRPQDKDLCLSFALFKILRRRFAGYQLAAEAGSSWAFRFVCDGLLLGRGEKENDDHERVFRVIATELSFASDYFHSPLPVASLGTTVAALHFFFSLIILPSLLLLALVLLLVLEGYVWEWYYFLMSGESNIKFPRNDWYRPWVLLALVLTLVLAGIEISEMVDSVRSNWTKISIIGHFVRSRHRGARRFLARLLKTNTPEFWDDEIGQTQMLKPDLFVVQQPCRPRQLLSLRRPRRNHHNKDDDTIKVPLVVKKAILKSLRSSGGQLSDGTEAIRRRVSSFGNNNITWACRDGGGVNTTTDAILVWHVATTLFDMKCRSSDSPPGSPPPPSTTPVADEAGSKVVVARCLSCYCMYLVAEAPDLLLDKPFWITRHYEAVKKCIDEAPKCSGEDDVYKHVLDTFSAENSHSHEVLINGAKLAKQLAEEDEDKVWDLLSDFWTEMVLYLAPSDNVKVHIEALQRGGELLTLLWALLLHAGITSRPVEFNFTANVLISTGDSDAIAVHNC